MENTDFSQTRANTRQLQAEHKTRISSWTNKTNSRLVQQITTRTACDPCWSKMKTWRLLKQSTSVNEEGGKQERPAWLMIVVFLPIWQFSGLRMPWRTGPPNTNQHTFGPFLLVSISYYVVLTTAISCFIVISVINRQFTGPSILSMIWSSSFVFLCFLKRYNKGKNRT